MMSFDKDKTGWLYLIENRQLKARKFGITNNLEQRLGQHGLDWEVVFAYHHNGWMVAILESQLKAWISGRVKPTTITNDDMHHNGASETYPINWRVSNKKVLKYLTQLIAAVSHK